METAYLAGGCFWCVEAIFQRVKGVKKLESGYCNGSNQNPSYESVCSGQTGHAEVVKIDFDESDVSFHNLLEVFMATHDPTSLNQQVLIEERSIDLLSSMSMILSSRLQPP